MSLGTKEQCYQSANTYTACIEFNLDEQHRRGFHAGQLIDYSLDPNPDADRDRSLPPQKLVVRFGTADVVVLGWRLDLIVNYLRDNRLAALTSLPKRYAELDANLPFVASIEIKPAAEKKDF